MLDTNVAWHAPMKVLRALRDRGHLITISTVAIGERWARVFRAEKPRLLRRAHALNEVVDPALPLIEHGYPLDDMLGFAGAATPPSSRWAVVAPVLREAWDVISKGEDPHWKERGRMINSAIDESAASWKGDVTRPVEGFRELLLSMPRKRALAMLVRAHLNPANFTLPGCTPSHWDSWNAWFSVQSLFIYNSTVHGIAPSDNDREDIRLLQFLAAPLILVTEDFRFIEDRVEASGTHQAPWVLTPAELLLRPPPTGVPWGANAQRVMRKHKVRSRDQLNNLRAILHEQL